MSAPELSRGRYMCVHVAGHSDFFLVLIVGIANLIRDALPPGTPAELNPLVDLLHACAVDFVDMIAFELAKKPQGRKIMPADLKAALETLGLQMYLPVYNETMETIAAEEAVGGAGILVGGRVTDADCVLRPQNNARSRTRWPGTYALRASRCAPHNIATRAGTGPWHPGAPV
jgi:hypothetical protein